MKSFLATLMIISRTLVLPTQAALQPSSLVNIAVVHDGDDIGLRGVEAAIAYLEDRVTVKQTIVPFSRDRIEVVRSEIARMSEEAAVPFAVLDITRSSVTGDAMKNLSRALGLTTVTTTYGYQDDLRAWQNLTDDEKAFLVQIRPPGDTMAQCARDIAVKFGFNNAAILFDQTFVMEHQYKRLLLNVPTRHIIQEVGADDDALGKQLDLFHHADIANYFLFTSSEQSKRIFQKVAEKRMFARNYAWYTMSKDSDDVDHEWSEDCQVLVIGPEPVNRTALEDMRVRFNMSSDRMVDSGFYFDVAVMAIEALLRQGSNGTDHNITREMMNQKRKGIYGPFLFGGNGVNQQQLTLNLTKVVLRSGKRRSTREGTWMANLRANSMKLSHNLTGFLPIVIYKVTTIHAPPFMYVTKLANNTTQFKGLCVDMIDSLKKIVDFEYEIHEVGDNRYGRPNGSGAWTGMFGELMDKKAHIALGPIFVTSERETVVDFSIPYYDLVGIRILMLRPVEESSLFKFLSVMEASVWACILGAYFCTSILLWLVDRFSPFSYQNNRAKYEGDPEMREFTLKESLWFCVTSLTPQGGGDAPKNASGRMVAATWWLFSFIVIASYTANLAAFLTVSRLESPVDSLDALANQYRIQYAPVTGTTVMDYFQRMANIERRFYEIWKDMSLNASITDAQRAELSVWDYPVSDRYTKMWTTMKETGMPASFAEGMQRLRNSSGNFALLADSTDARYEVLVTCDTMVVGDEFSRRPYGIAVQKGSPLKEQLSLGILKLQNQRDMERFKEKWWQRNPERVICDDSNEQTDGIGMNNIGGVFIVVCLGIATAAITLLLEYWWYRFRGRKAASTPTTAATAPAPALSNNKVTQIKVKQAFESQSTALTKRRYYFAS